MIAAKSFPHGVKTAGLVGAGAATAAATAGGITALADPISVPAASAFNALSIPPVTKFGEASVAPAALAVPAVAPVTPDIDPTAFGFAEAFVTGCAGGTTGRDGIADTVGRPELAVTNEPLDVPAVAGRTTTGGVGKACTDDADGAVPTNGGVAFAAGGTA